MTPIKDLGVWTYDECALVLVDFQKEMFETIHSETSADLIELHVSRKSRRSQVTSASITERR